MIFSRFLKIISKFLYHFIQNIFSATQFSTIFLKNSRNLIIIFRELLFNSLPKIFLKISKLCVHWRGTKLLYVVNVKVFVERFAIDVLHDPTQSTLFFMAHCVLTFHKFYLKRYQNFSDNFFGTYQKFFHNFKISWKFISWDILFQIYENFMVY